MRGRGPTRDPRPDPNGHRARRGVLLRTVRTGVAAALIASGLLVVLAQCGGHDVPPELSDAPDVDQEEQEAVPADDSARVSADLVRLTVPTSVAGGFPHGTHGDVECTQCHTTLAAHGSHSDVECTDCHQGPAWLGERVVFSRDECSDCHHDPEQPRTCEACHGEAISRPRITRTAAANPTTGSGPTTRELLFGHEDHGTLACTDCHTEPVSRDPSRECRSCHQDHHRDDTDCGLCHGEPLLEVHDLRAHVGCGGAGCHEEPVTARLGPTRSVCTACHAEQTTHYPEGDCAECHRVSPSGRTSVRGTG